MTLVAGLARADQGSGSDCSSGGVALSAPTSKSECTPLFVGELVFSKFPHGEGMYQPPPEEGKVQYMDAT